MADVRHLSTLIFIIILSRFPIKYYAKILTYHVQIIWCIKLLFAISTTYKWPLRGVAGYTGSDFSFKRKI